MPIHVYHDANNNPAERTIVETVPDVPGAPTKAGATAEAIRGYVVARVPKEDRVWSQSGPVQDVPPFDRSRMTEKANEPPKDGA